MTLNLIKSVVCAYFGLTEEELNKQTRKREYVEPRQIYHYLSRELTRCSFSEIAKPFDHTTSLYSFRTISDRMEFDKELRKTIQIIEFKLDNLDLDNFHSDTLNFINFRTILINKILKCQSKEEIKNIFESVDF